MVPDPAVPPGAPGEGGQAGEGGEAAPAVVGERAEPRTAPVWAALAAAVGLAAFFPLGSALGAWLSPPRPASGAPVGLVAWLEVLPALAVTALVAGWLFVFWSVVGSFLNVVVYRLPLGRSVVSGRSSCPRCDRAIAWHDNLPVAGWLLLGGRCRSCSLPIAARYPIVEALCAGLCTALFFRELPSDGVNIPLRPPGLWTGINWIVTSLQGDLIALYAWHCLTLCTLLAWGLIVQDGHAVPGRSARGVLFVATLVSAAYPQVHPLPVGAVAQPASAASGDWLGLGIGVSLAGVVAGMVAGFALGGIIRLRAGGDAAGRRGVPLLPPLSLGAGLALVGIVCGWQGLVGTVALVLVTCFAQVLVWSAVRTWPAVAPELLLVPATFVHLCWWRQLGDGLGGWWPGPAAGTACLAIPTVLAALLGLALVAIAPAAHTRPGLPPPD